MAITSPVTRSWPPTHAADEADLAWRFLDFLRATAVGKAHGLTPALAAATPLPGSPLMSVLGLLKHLTAVERHWITRTAGGSDLPLLWDPDDATAEWRLTPTDTPHTVLAAYQAEWTHARTACHGLTPDDPARADPAYTVRWILAHVAQETARHVGHLDILRELADGETGE